MSQVSGDDDVPLSMYLFEAFRSKLFHYPFEEASDEEMKELLDSPDSGMAVLFSFLTFVH